MSAFWASAGLATAAAGTAGLGWASAAPPKGSAAAARSAETTWRLREARLIDSQIPGGEDFDGFDGLTGREGTPPGRGVQRPPGCCGCAAPAVGSGGVSAAAAEDAAGSDEGGGVGSAGVGAAVAVGATVAVGARGGGAGATVCVAAGTGRGPFFPPESRAMTPMITQAPSRAPTATCTTGRRRLGSPGTSRGASSLSERAAGRAGATGEAAAGGGGAAKAGEARATAGAGAGCGATTGGAAGTAGVAPATMTFASGGLSLRGSTSTGMSASSFARAAGALGSGAAAGLGEASALGGSGTVETRPSARSIAAFELLGALAQASRRAPCARRRPRPPRSW